MEGWAEFYAAQGLPVVTVWGLYKTGENPVCRCILREKCRDAGKHPRTSHGANDGTTDLAKRRRWKWESGNIGICTGEASGVLVIDVDPRSGGRETIEELQRQLGKLPAGPLVATGGGGWHGYMRYPGGADGKLEPGIEIRSELGPGVQIKANGGMVVAPPSLHKSGKRYVWARDRDLESVEFPALPDGWVEAIFKCGCDENSNSCYTDPLNPCYTYPTTNPTCYTEDPEDPEEPRGSMDTLAAVAATTFADQSVVGNASFIDHCIAETLPRFQGERHAQIFQLARLLKARFPAAAPTDFREDVMAWYGQAIGRLGVDKIRADATENWGDFCEGWGKIKYLGKDALPRALLARAQTAPDPAAAAGYSDPKVKLLIRLCKELQTHRGNKPFPLSTRMACRLLGIKDRMRAHRWLTALVADGVLECTFRGDRVPGGRASEFKYLGD